jgi:hypothetical protein
MFFKGDKTPSFEYRRNEFCHRILDTIYRHASPIIRENTFGEMIESVEGLLISKKYFLSIDIIELSAKFNEPDVFIQDCCEFLESNKHIIASKNHDIIYNIKFTNLGVDAFKTDYYLKQNKKQDYATQLRKSTLLNNVLTPIVAFVTLVVAIATFVTQKQEYKDNPVTQEQFRQQLQSIDNIRQLQTNALYLLLINTQKSVSKQIDTPKQNDTTR